jgi:flagellar hook-length control protein FliK
VEAGLQTEAPLGFGEALLAATGLDAAAVQRSTEKPERPLAQPLLAEPVAAALPQPEPMAGLNANPLPVETAAAVPVPTQATLEHTPGTVAFTAALGAQLSVWVAEGVEMAQLELNPRDLGPIEVRIAMRDGQARIELGADVTSTREALAQALPSLAEALGDVGVQLAGSGMSDQGSAQRQAQQDAGRQPSAALAALAQAFGRADGAANGAEAQERVPAQGRPRSLVDLVA